MGLDQLVPVGGAALIGLPCQNRTGKIERCLDPGAIRPCADRSHQLASELERRVPLFGNFAHQGGDRGQILLDEFESSPERAARGADGGFARKIGRESWRERVCPYVLISVVDVSLKKKNERYKITA